MESKINIAIISNIVLEPYLLPITKEQFDKNAIIINIPYDEYLNDEYIIKIRRADIITVFLNFETLFCDVSIKKIENINQKDTVIDKIISLCKSIVTSVKSLSTSTIVWFLFEDYYNKLQPLLGYNTDCFVDNINSKIVSTLSCDNISFIDFKRLIAEIGIKDTYDLKGKYRWNAPYSNKLIGLVVKAIHKQYSVIKGITKKCIILDCDNVLWGGILSEDGIENIKLGSSGSGLMYYDFQRFILSLYYHGVILAVCSKNDLSDVMMMFSEHSGMILQEKHISCFQVNWENKPDNIKRIADILNIGLNSMVFIDDSPVEIETVKAILPDVTTILFKTDSIYKDLSCFNLKSNVSITDIERRSNTYRTNQSRKDFLSQYQSYDKYIDALEIKMIIHEVLPIEVSRVSELTQRTNKCTNGKRYETGEIQDRINSKNIKIYSLAISDRFSDLGLVGVIEVEDEKLTLFSLSCRALGCRIENEMIDFLKMKHKIKTIEFFLTGKNQKIMEMLKYAFPEAVLII